MAVLEINCNNQKLNWKEEPTQLFSGNIKIDGITFSFCPLWDGFIKTAVFYKDGEENNAFYFVLDENNTCFIPHELTGTSGLIYVGVFGVKDECRRTTEPIAFYLDKGIVTEGNPSDPTPDIYAQIVTLCNKAVETANGIEERANNGEFNGKDGYTPKKGVDYFDGQDGTNGKDGKDGVDGKNGIDGKDGYTPQKNIDYFDGKDGQDGKTPVKGVDYFTEEDIDGLNDELNFVKDATCELIEEITITEEGVREIIRTAEPDGTPYNFKAVTVYQTVKPCEIQNLIQVGAYSDVDGKNSVGRFQGANAPTTSGRFLTVHFDVIGGCWRDIGSFTTIQGSPTGVSMWRDTTPYKGERIKCVILNGYTTAFEVGTIIRIYGVRA